MELVSIQNHLVEGRVREGKSLAFLYPSRGGFDRRYVDFVQAGSVDGRSQLAEDILFFQCLDETMVVFIRNQIPAGFVLTLPQDVADILEVGSQGSQHGRPVLVRCASCCGLARTPGQWLGCRATHCIIQLLQPFQPCNLLTVVLDFPLHFLIGLYIRSRDQAIVHSVCFKEVLGCFPCETALFLKFTHSHTHGISPHFSVFCGNHFPKGVS